MNSTGKNALWVFGITFLILAIPFVAMQFSPEVNWSVFDFLVAGALLLSAGFGIARVLRRKKPMLSKMAWVMGIVLLLILVWAELAVGVFGTPFAGS
jgi:uncharacterized membrane protein